jgi:hypothetical protein
MLAFGRGFPNPCRKIAVPVSLSSPFVLVDPGPQDRGSLHFTRDIDSLHFEDCTFVAMSNRRFRMSFDISFGGPWVIKTPVCDGPSETPGANNEIRNPRSDMALSDASVCEWAWPPSRESEREIKSAKADPPTPKPTLSTQEPLCIRIGVISALLPTEPPYDVIPPEYLEGTTLKHAGLYAFHSAIAWSHLRELLTTPRMGRQFIIYQSEMDAEVKQVTQPGDPVSTTPHPAPPSGPGSVAQHMARVLHMASLAPPICRYSSIRRRKQDTSSPRRSSRSRQRLDM